MLNDNRVTVTICGKEYTMHTAEEPSYVKQLAARLDRKVREVMEGNDIISTTDAALLVGLSLMDDSYKTTSDIDNFRTEIRNYVEEAGKARDECDRLREQLEELKRENERLTTELGLHNLREKIE